MHHTTRIRSWGNIALGAVFAAGTGYALFEDVIRHSAPITTDHVMTALVLVGTIAAGHLFFPTASAKRFLPAVGLALIFAAGTFICVVGSAGRVAEVSNSKEAEANKHNGSREDAIEQLKKARADRAELAARFAKECGSGKGPRCDGTKASIEYADSHIAILQVRVDQAKPEQQANGTLKHAAKVFELFLPYSAKQIEAGLVLLWPFAKALMLDTMHTQGADSFAGRLVSVIQGSSETTFYVLAVYFGSVGIRRTRYAAGCGLFADVVGFAAAVAVTYAFFG